jgi:SAM-dependent methyltransferase
MRLPFADGSFDVVACQFGAMFFPDKAQAFSEARRLLRPGGVLVFNTWDRIEENDFAHTVTRTLASLYPSDPPRFMERTPHGYFRLDAIADDLAQAGFLTAPRFESITSRSRAESAQVAATAYCQGTPLRGEIEARAGARLEDATSACAADLAARFGGGMVEGRIRAHVVEVVR